jgi:hypothetical protein
MKKLVAMFALTVSFALASATNFNVTLFQPSVVAGTELKPGEYKVQVNGDKMTIKNGKKVIEASVKSEQVDSKFGSTSVRYVNGDGKYTVTEIRIGGTNTKLVVN